MQPPAAAQLHGSSGTAYDGPTEPWGFAFMGSREDTALQ